MTLLPSTRFHFCPMADITLTENSPENGISRREIQAALAKTVELRALHAALMQGSSPSLRFPSSSPLSFHNPNVSAQDYPVFTPSYENEPLPGYRQIQPESWSYGESWRDNVEETMQPDYRTPNASSRNRFPPETTTTMMDFDTHTCPPEDQISVSGSCPNHTNIHGVSPAADLFSKSRRNSLEDTKSVSSCNKCKPAVISRESDSVLKSGRKSNIVVPLMDSQSSPHSQPRKRGLGLSWLLLKMKKNSSKNGAEEQSQVSKERTPLPLSFERLKQQVVEANERRDAAMSEALEIKSSLGELTQKMEYLESYCEELKRALKQAKIPSSSGKLLTEEMMPVSEEVMEEGFLQVVSEARMSVKQLCKTLLRQIVEHDDCVVENLNSLLQPYKLDLSSSKHSRSVVYHLEAIMNQILYQDFENCVYQNNGAPKILNPRKQRQAQFQSFVALRDLSWNEVLRKGTKFYSEDFSRFCDQKMSGIIAVLRWTRPWPEQLLEAFFMAAKCLWLLHLLAFSFEQPLGILRVGDDAEFDGHYMEDVFPGRRQGGGERVKVMVMPGFYVVNKVLKCKVLCRHDQSVS